MVIFLFILLESWLESYLVRGSGYEWFGSGIYLFKHILQMGEI